MNAHTDDWRGEHLIRSAPRRQPREFDLVASSRNDRRKASAALTADSPQIIRMAEMWKQGFRRVDIARETGLTEVQVSRWRDRLGLPHIGLGNKPTFSRAEAVALYEELGTLQAVALRLGVKAKTVSDAINGKRVADGGKG